jgi:hypothetical protein
MKSRIAVLVASIGLALLHASVRTAAAPVHCLPTAAYPDLLGNISSADTWKFPFRAVNLHTVSQRLLGTLVPPSLSPASLPHYTDLFPLSLHAKAMFDSLEMNPHKADNAQDRLSGRLLAVPFSTPTVAMAYFKSQFGTSLNRKLDHTDLQPLVSCFSPTHSIHRTNVILLLACKSHLVPYIQVTDGRVL